MPSAKRKAKHAGAPKPRRAKKPFPVGPDGKTANDRLREILGSHPIFQGREADLVRACNRLFSSPGDSRDYILQQQVNNFLRDVDSFGRSQYVPGIAKALGVEAVWLQSGRGPRDPYDVLQEFARWQQSGGKSSGSSS